MQQDNFGLETTIASSAALDSWNKAVLAFLAHGASTPNHLVAALKEAPCFALGHATKGLFFLLLGRRELVQTAREALADAETCAAATPVTAREQCYIDALRAWLDGWPSQAIQRLENVLRVNPEDALAMKLSHAIRFVLGDSHGMRASIENLLPAYGADHVARGYLFGCYSFALEETGDYGRAETVGRMGLGLSSNDAWGLHAVAHVFDMTGNSRGGINWLEGRDAAWAHCNNFRFHVWWHKALMHLDQGEYDTVLDLYDAQIRAEKTDDYRDISNATSLLSRLELEGIDVGNRWEELADVSMERTEDGCLIFADLHYLLALVGGKRRHAVEQMLGRLHRDAKRCSSEMSTFMAQPGVSAAHGLQAFGEADYRSAFLNLARARHSMQNAGGSHAQRDVFERLTIDSGIRAGFLDEAEGILRERTARRAQKEDAYAEARMAMITAGRAASRLEGRVPAE